MKVKQALDICREYHRAKSQFNTIRSYEFVFTKLIQDYSDEEMYSISTDNMFSFLIKITEGTKASTKKNRFTVLHSFFNFFKNNIDPSFKSPCDSIMMKKFFRAPIQHHWKMMDKDDVDEIIFRTINIRNRILLELMARGGMRVGEVLQFTPSDLDNGKIFLKRAKSGRVNECVYIPQRLNQKLLSFISQKNISPSERVFSISYSAARKIVNKAGKIAGIHLRPHDLRRYAATYASRAGTPLEIISKVILRHSNLTTTQRYLGKVSDVEAMKWIENLYG